MVYRGQLTSKFLLCGLSLVLLFSCNPDKPSGNVENVTENSTSTGKPYTAVAPEFKADSAYYWIEKQVALGPRIPNSKAQKQCAELIITALKDFGLKINVQKAQVLGFDGKMLSCTNITGSVNPENTNRIFLSGHWDTRPFADQDTKDKDVPIDGANDGGSSTGILLEIARVIGKNKPNIGVDLIFFDVEDYGQPSGSKFPYMEDSYCLGSQYWAKNKPMSYMPKYGINLDMVGNSGATFTKEATSVNYAYGVVEKVWQTAAKIGYGNYFINKNTNGITDDHAYINEIAKIPTIDIIHHDERTNSNFPETWHTHNDNLKNIDKSTLKAVGQTMLEVIYTEK